MKSIIILYPKLFNCYDKFERKISKIIKNIDDFSVIYQDDPHEFIINFFKEKYPNISLIKNNDWESDDITHGIIFDDGDEFIKETISLKSNDIPLRVIKIVITRVVNIKNETQYKSEKSTLTYEYIGRGSYWGNPYSMYEGGEERDEVIRKYKYDFDYEKFPKKEKSEVYKLAGKRLGCFCKPQTCHGDVLADYLNSWDDGK
ncbi:hypothetical protein BMR07_17220 [Methylococcaceae bacterium CS1]|nr:hypothetical protein BMR07_17220 [Methylococcaceae bacterium CS1]TXL20099.1 hypothetical protein BMR03_14665 [Methylococcaceae bacterium HT2]